jgi:hypothetical protein
MRAWYGIAGTLREPGCRAARKRVAMIAPHRFPKGSVGTKQPKNHAVTPVKLSKLTGAEG